MNKFLLHILPTIALVSAQVAIVPHRVRSSDRVIRSSSKNQDGAFGRERSSLRSNGNKHLQRQLEMSMVQHELSMVQHELSMVQHELSMVQHNLSLDLHDLSMPTPSAIDEHDYAVAPGPEVEDSEPEVNEYCGGNVECPEGYHCHCRFSCLFCASSDSILHQPSLCGTCRST